MKRIFTLILLLASITSFSQNVNLILLVNGKIITTEIANVYVEFTSNNRRINVNYEPGNLVFDNEVWENINKDSNQKFFLHFDFYTYVKDKQYVANFDIELSKYLIERSYLIADIYDFRKKSIKRKYQYLTDKNYLVQFYYRPENGTHGIYIPER
ncbi:hypothetical protein [Myroides odoratimimus]|uniref:hypothetical protein n=1 Tax=Myroides odoratimimus TaxID=76832 RepID=UPI0025766D87|nr:hypothetical protein [Myroides odoratimimus]MDM1093182.1 hypothetical protein [Myroides odoratimimus]MDM1527577.1 hypothetical protein [Myroides odoratimimus]